MTDTETPEVTARVEENWAALEVGGETQTIRADSEEEVRHEVLRRTMQIAAAANRDVSLVATDRDGEWRLIVTPQGDISETGTPVRAAGAHQGGDAAQSSTDAAAHAAPDDEVTGPPEAGDEEQPLWISPPPGSDEQSVPTGPVAAVAAAPQGAVEPESDRIGYAFSGAIDDTGSSGEIVADPDELRDSPIDEDTVRREAIFPPEAPLTVDPPAVGTSTADVAPVEHTTTTDAADDPIDEATTFRRPARASAGDATGEEIAAPAAAQPPAPASAAPARTLTGGALPTLADFQASQPAPVAGPAVQGWRGAIRRGTGGLISPKASPAEQRRREAIASVTRSLSGPRTICVINPKGGAHKTTAAMLIAATFGMYRGGYTLAWDNNETRGTLGWRAHQSGHTNTAVNLLHDLDRFADPRSARVGDLDNYVRSQAESQFDVLASDEDAAASSMIDGDAFRRLHETLQRFYRVIVVDTGNNMRASNWEAAIAAADQLVIVSAIREDTAGGAAWMVEGLAKKGQEAKLRDAVTLLSAPDKYVDASLRTRLVDHFGSLTRDVVEVPYDSALVSGGGISIKSLSPATRDAWLMATATIANGL